MNRRFCVDFFIPKESFLLPKPIFQGKIRWSYHIKLSLMVLFFSFFTTLLPAKDDTILSFGAISDPKRPSTEAIQLAIHNYSPARLLDKVTYSEFTDLKLWGSHQKQSAIFSQNSENTRFNGNWSEGFYNSLPYPREQSNNNLTIKFLINNATKLTSGKPIGFYHVSNNYYNSF